eukprot:Nk52_evm38s234 gene=Nk52_evmTU38s234
MSARSLRTGHTASLNSFSRALGGLRSGILPCLIKKRGIMKSHAFSTQQVGNTEPLEDAKDDKVEKDETGSTHFGFKTIKEEEKETLVGNVFKSVAGNYDIMNDVMSGGVHRLWKDYFIQKLNPVDGSRLLDVAGGTGDITFRFLDYRNSKGEKNMNSNATVLDINPAMLEVGKKRAPSFGYGGDSRITWVEGNAEHLPFPDNSFDVFTMSFGIRNCTHIDKVVEEAHRVLVPGGRFMCLEFSHVPYMGVKDVYDFYSFNLIPFFGEKIAGDRDSYQYLVESIRKFPDQETFCSIIREAGFKRVSYENLTLGVAAIHSGFKL